MYGLVFEIVEEWAEKALTERDPSKQVEALLALARVAGTCPLHRNDSTPPVDTKEKEENHEVRVKEEEE